MLSSSASLCLIENLYLSIWFGRSVVWQGKAKVHKLVRDNAVICLSKEIINNFLTYTNFLFCF